MIFVHFILGMCICAVVARLGMVFITNWIATNACRFTDQDDFQRDISLQTARFAIAAEHWPWAVWFIAGLGVAPIVVVILVMIPVVHAAWAFRKWRGK